MRPLAYSIAELVRIGPLSRSMLFEEIRSGRLRAVKAGRRTLILPPDFEQYLADLPSARSVTPPNDRLPGKQRHTRGERRLGITLTRKATSSSGNSSQRADTSGDGDEEHRTEPSQMA